MLTLSADGQTAAGTVAVLVEDQMDKDKQVYSIAPLLYLNDMLSLVGNNSHLHSVIPNHVRDEHASLFLTFETVV